MKKLLSKIICSSFKIYDAFLPSLLIFCFSQSTLSNLDYSASLLFSILGSIAFFMCLTVLAILMKWSIPLFLKKEITVKDIIQVNLAALRVPTIILFINFLLACYVYSSEKVALIISLLFLLISFIFYLSALGHLFYKNMNRNNKRDSLIAIYQIFLIFLPLYSLKMTIFGIYFIIVPALIIAHYLGLFLFTLSFFKKNKGNIKNKDNTKEDRKKIYGSFMGHSSMKDRRKDIKYCSILLLVIFLLIAAIKIANYALY